MTLDEADSRHNVEQKAIPGVGLGDLPGVRLGEVVGWGSERGMGVVVGIG